MKEIYQSPLPKDPNQLMPSSFKLQTQNKGNLAEDTMGDESIVPKWSQKKKGIQLVKAEIIEFDKSPQLKQKPKLKQTRFPESQKSFTNKARTPKGSNGQLDRFQRKLQGKMQQMENMYFN